MTGTPAVSSAATMACTSSLVNWWRLWCDPSRSDVSVIRTSQMGLKKIGTHAGLLPDAAPRASARRRRDRLSFGDLLADLGGGRGHDVEVPGVRRQVVAGTLHLDERRDERLAAGVDRRVVELRLVEQPVARDVGLHLGDDVADGLRDRVAVGVLGNRAEDGVAHDHWRVGRVEDDDRLAALGAADRLDALAGGLGELVDVGARARARPRPTPPTPRSRRRARRRTRDTA